MRGLNLQRITYVKLGGRDVPPREAWKWPRPGRSPSRGRGGKAFGGCFRHTAGAVGPAARPGTSHLRSQQLCDRTLGRPKGTAPRAAPAARSPGVAAPQGCECAPDPRPALHA
ncbi:unnamed protein product [Rangifer tarandus platyrhynchus]|uniref:Uncharacterized protein n=2 Tax=Rangifer tarandus platyrhynchus TaxID=3082113 RepID=A0AC59YB53_RANTA|nr:unnamed protein product [Rangifer tarandus platyrhynchus]